LQIDCSGSGDVRQYARSVEFRILGPIEVRRGDRPLALGGPRQRQVLAHLVLEANRVISTDRLIQLTWGDQAPESARQALFAYVSRLRKIVGADRIVARPPGYTLVAERHEVDALRFVDAVAQARDLADDPASASAKLGEALGLWRGDALSDLADHEALGPEIARLADLRLEALEDRIQFQMDLGHHRDELSTLEQLVREHPLRERPWGQLILAHYRSGRQANALAAYQRARAILLEDLGIDPSPELRQLHEQILRQDPALTWPIPGALSQGSSAVATLGARERRWRRRRPLAALAGAGLASVVVLVTIVGSGGSPTQTSAETWTIGVTMPLSGPDAELGVPVRNAVQLAVDDINERGGVAGADLELVIADDAQDADRAAANARGFVADRSVVAMVGPWGSGPSFTTLPITNEAGLLECSPAATHPGLTKSSLGALDLRAAHPDEVNFVRLPPADDIQAVALASFARVDLDSRFALVVTTSELGAVIADPFEEQFEPLGGRTQRIDPGVAANPGAALAPLDGADPPDLVFFGGMSPGDAAAVRRAMVRSGQASTPMLSWDFIRDGDGRDAGSYIRRIGGADATGTYAAHASLPDHRFAFADSYRRQFGDEPDEYAAAGYACVEIIAAGLRDILDEADSPEQARALVRNAVSDPAQRFETVLGTVGFDANGDARQQFVTFYRVDSSAAGGAGDWVIFKKQDFGPAP
jgi:ABC-type branched-subunit amino acid transport system substrate-binding protein/DNA-binding SARP family transcriptional activator